MQKFKKFFGIFLFLIIAALALAGVVGMTVNAHVQKKEKANIVAVIESTEDTLTDQEIATLKENKPDSILVLGCGIKDENTPSPMLRDRLETAILLYEAGIAPKILLTGDNGTMQHNELKVMFKYVVKAGVPKKDIFCDHAGFSTYESMWRADNVFQVKSTIIVTQNYHMYRSLYIAHKLGLKAYGVSSNQKKYSGQPSREIREVLARNKDAIKCIFKPEATFGGDPIPITGSGIISQQGADDGTE